MRFGHFPLDGSEGMLSSLRVRGLSSRLFACKRPWQPADPLTTSEAVRMHGAMNDSSQSLYDRIIVGHLLHMIYSRSRWSDLLAVCHVYLDESSTYLEAVAFAHKGAKSSDKKTRLLPIFAPVGWQDLRALVASQSSCCQRRAKLDLMVGHLDI